MTNLSDADVAIEELLAGARQGQTDAADRLFALLYEELRAQAHLVLRIGARQTLCTTELVNETWLRLSGRALPVESRRHYCNLVARAMRQLLIDRARLRQADKRGDGGEPLTLSAAADIAADEPLDVLALDRVMGALTAADPLLAELAGLHLFGGLGFAEIAELRGVSERTVFRDWRAARMFLLRYMDATG
ncbi:MAG TPA: ECF-type sigma factor [Tahibacter sp.]|nr:ECF-type sigma factor [Tahibacter sp.]